jgi:hypothetical protein
MKTFKNLLEAKGGKVVVSFGRMNPMTNGHEKLANKLKSVAQSEGATARLYLSHSTNPKKDPLDFATKVKFAKKAFGNIVQSSAARTIIEVFKELNGKFSDVIVVVGSDRIPEFKTLLNKYNGKDYNFNSIDIVSAGERDPDAEGVEGMSGSKMRKFAEMNDFESFSKGVPSKLSDADAKKLFDEVRKGMNINEHFMNEFATEELDEAVLSLAGRRKRAMQLRRMKSKIAVARQRAMKRFASPEVLNRRARRMAINFLKQRYSSGKSYADLSPGQKVSIDQKVQKLMPVVGKIASRLLPQVRRAEVQRKAAQRAANQQESFNAEINEKFELFIEAPKLPQDKHVGGKEGTQPAKYYKGLEKDTKEKRDAHFKAHAQKSDSDPSSYKDAPGDKEARERDMPQSKHTKKYKDMFGEAVDKQEMGRLNQLIRLGLADKKMLATIQRAVTKIDAGDTLNPAERDATQNLLMTLLDIVTTNNVFTTTKGQLSKVPVAQMKADYAKYVGEDLELDEAAYPGNIGMMELAKFFQKATPEQIGMFKELLAKKDVKRAWALVSGVTGIKLIGKEFNEAFVYEDDGYEGEDEADWEDEESDGLYMAKIELSNLIADAEEILMMLESMEEEPEAWVTSKITLAVDYIGTARDYLEFHGYAEPPEEEEDDEDEAEFSGEESYDAVYECIKDMDKEELGELYEDVAELFEEVEGLKKKAEKSGIPYGILKKVYDRGMAAWKGGHRPGTTPQQWAFARVNSFITKGKGTWGGADSDLAAKVGGAKEKNEEFSNFIEALEWGTDELRKKYADDTPGQTTEIQVADHIKADDTLNAIFKQNMETVKSNFSEDIAKEIDRCLTEGVDLIDNNYRLGSEKFFEFFRAVRESGVELKGLNKHLIEETDIGEIVEHEGKHVPLDCPMIEEEEMTLWKYNPASGLWKSERTVTPETKDKWLEIFKKDDPKAKFIVSKNKPGAKAHLKEEDEKDPPLNQPKRGGPKKFYVFVRDPSSGNIKKVTWGDTTGLTVKMNDPEARKSFAARHQCSTQKDRTSAAYWACNTPRYAKQLGLSGGGNFYW